MKRHHLLPLLAALGALPAQAAQLDVSVQIPQLDVAEYHRPYVAVWVEREDRSVAAQLSVWYQVKRNGPNGGPPAVGADGKPQSGTKWLPDLRQWWRRTGRTMTVPADGITGATRAVGVHEVSYTQGKAPLGELAPGKYRLLVEAAREEGGRELLEIPFEWPAAGKQTLEAKGSRELGALALKIQP